MGKTGKPATIDEYLNGVTPEMRDALEKLRGVIAKAVPQAQEAIAWDMPMFKLGGKNLVGFAAFKQHYSLFPMSATVTEAFKDELSSYATTKGTIHFQPEKPLPVALIKKIVKYRVKEIEKGVRSR